MKNLKSIALALLAFVSVTTTAQTKPIDASKSTINCKPKSYLNLLKVIQIKKYFDI